MAGTKKAFGAAAAGTDYKASIAFLVNKSFTAQGQLKFYFKSAETNPEYRESVAGYRLWSVTMPVKNTGFGAIKSVAA